MTTYADVRITTINNVGRDQYNITNVTFLDQTLRRLEPARMDASMRSECLRGTRTDILRSIVDWKSNRFTERVLWLYGLAGSGKSTIANTISNLFREHGCLGAFLFFNRDTEERSQPSNVIRTIAYQLASFCPRIGTAIAAAIDGMPSIVLSPLRLQFTKLLAEPLSTLPLTEPPIVVVLDALDECGNSEDRRDLLAILTTNVINLHPSIRILITSRAEFDIRAAFLTSPHTLAQQLDISSNHNFQDILIFLHVRMSEIRSANTSLRLPPDWPGELSLKMLAQRAAGLFVWAATACRFIDGHDPRNRLDVLLRNSAIVGAEAALNTLYQTAVESAGLWDDGEFCADFKVIMGTILVAKKPLSANAIDTLLSLQRPARHTILRLQCVLTWSETEPIRILHPSFADFISDHLRCGSFSWHINTSTHNRCFAIICLNYLGRVLRRNICDLKLSFSSVNEVLSDAISYTCLSWMDHIFDITDSEGTEFIVDTLEQFLFQHLLHWLEVMSILNKSRTTVASVHRLLNWLRRHLPRPTKLHELVADASRFVQIFARSIEEHPLLIYLSALPFTPVRTLLYKTFASNDLPRIVGGYYKTWPPLLQIFSGYEGNVTSVAFIPNGTQIISAHRDGKIRIWDATSGAQILTPLVGHTAAITSIAISPDGRQIVSGSYDKTVRLWDTCSGEVMSPLMRGHTDVVYSVAFSPSGTRIASGSRDDTVRVWDVTSGCQLFAPLRGQMGSISSVKFSPNGLWILTGSLHKTICLWDSVRGTEILHPMIGHDAAVLSLAISPDSNWVVSGSVDSTIRVWDTNIGFRSRWLSASGAAHFKEVAFFPDSKRFASISYPDNRVRVWDTKSGAQLFASALQKDMCCMTVSPNGEQLVIGYHDATFGLWSAAFDEGIQSLMPCEDHIIALACSPNGDQIASSSGDGHTISVWGSYWGGEVVAPLRGYNDIASSIAFSPDGKLIACGLWYGIIRIWDAASCRETISPLRGHKGNVQCVAFSPDGCKIASGSFDETVRLWILKDGMPAFAPIRGHMDHIMSVNFSSDGMRVLSVCRRGITQVWDTTLGAVIYR